MVGQAHLQRGEPCNTINNYAQRAVVATETKVSEWINDVIRFVGELIFQMSYYGILVAQRIFMAIMMIFCPIMFAFPSPRRGTRRGASGCPSSFPSRCGAS